MTPYQASIIRPQLKVWLPANTQTADARYIGITTDNLEWMLKTTAEHPQLPISEWLCYHVFGACGLSLPAFAALDDSTQGPVFGSRWEGGVTAMADLTPDQQFWCLSDNAETFSACLALDLLLGNADRHFGNYLFRQNRQQRFGVLAMDFSRAMATQGWPRVLGSLARWLRRQITLSSAR